MQWSRAHRKYPVEESLPKMEQHRWVAKVLEIVEILYSAQIHKHMYFPLQCKACAVPQRVRTQTQAYHHAAKGRANESNLYDDELYRNAPVFRTSVAYRHTHRHHNEVHKEIYVCSLSFFCVSSCCLLLVRPLLCFLVLL